REAEDGRRRILLGGRSVLRLAAPAVGGYAATPLLRVGVNRPTRSYGRSTRYIPECALLPAVTIDLRSRLYQNLVVAESMASAGPPAGTSSQSSPSAANDSGEMEKTAEAASPMTRSPVP